VEAELVVERARRLAAPPGVEVAEQERGSALEARVVEQRADLAVSRAVAEREVRRDDVEDATLEGQLRGDRDPPLHARVGEVEHEDRPDRPTREDRVAELAEAVRARRREGDVEPEVVGERLERVLAREGPQHLLERDHVGCELRDHEARARGVGPAAPVVPRPAVDVVGRDGDLARERAQARRPARRPHQEELGQAAAPRAPQRLPDAPLHRPRPRARGHPHRLSGSPHHSKIAIRRRVPRRGGCAAAARNSPSSCGFANLRARGVPPM